MKFVDEVEITIQAGNGGPGSVHFMRVKYNPTAGPDGGDGGRGGDVYIEANPRMMTLGHLLHHREYHAEKGEPGRSKNQSGSSGADFTLQVPPGTEIVDKETDEVIGDLNFPGSRIMVAKGGKGGMGNQHFANSVNQAPEYAQPGLPGEKRSLILKLKLLADAGLVGMPNAGKSTLLSKISRSHPKIADYAFTTLTPNIGIVEGENYRRLILADIPGIIEGAHRGTGLGLSFLRHIERVRVLVYVIDISSMHPADELIMLKSELKEYSTKLLERPALIVLNKLDLVDFDEALARELCESVTDKALWKESGSVPEVVVMSAREDSGMNDFIEKLFALIPEKTLAEQMIMH